MWMPLKVRDAALETYIRKVRNDVNNQIKLVQNKTTRDHLSSAERKALKNLGPWQEITIKPANKGSAVVVLSKEDSIIKSRSF